MNISLMRFLDQRVAGFLCALATPAAWILQKLHRPDPARQVRRVLCLKFFGLGSLTRAAPMFLSLRRSLPQAELDIITFGENRPLLERLGVFRRIDAIDSSSPARTARDFLKCLGRLAFSRYDAVLDMEFFSNVSTLLAFVTNAPLRSGFFLRRSFRERVLTRTVYYNSAQHITDAYLALGRSIGGGDPGDPSELPWVREEDRRSLADVLQKHQVGPEERIVVFNVNASDLCLERRWPPERFRELCRRLRAEASIRPVFIGTRSQRDYVDSVVSPLGDPSCLNLAGETDFGGLLALLQRAALVVGNDSGPLHVAEALRRPVAALYGPESPVHYGMRGSNTLTYFANLYCSPCLNAANVKVAPCAGRNVCMSRIPVEDVVRGSLALLRGETVPAELSARWNGYDGKFSRTDWLTAAGEEQP